MMPEITLSQGKVALIDEADVALVSPYKWHAHLADTNWYARTTTKKRRVYMHRLILAAVDGELVDHINRDSLDNRRANLRTATAQINAINSRKRRGSSSTYRGVCWATNKKLWLATITNLGAQKFLGYFATEEAAAHAYDLAARSAFGEYAPLNFADGGRR